MENFIFSFLLPSHRGHRVLGSWLQTGPSWRLQTSREYTDENLSVPIFQMNLKSQLKQHINRKKHARISTFIKHENALRYFSGYGLTMFFCIIFSDLKQKILSPSFFVFKRKEPHSL